MRYSKLEKVHVGAEIVMEYSDGSRVVVQCDGEKERQEFLESIK